MNLFDVPPPYELSATTGVYASESAPVGIFGMRLSYRLVDWVMVRGAYEGGAAFAVLPAEAGSTDPVVPTGLTVNRFHLAAVTTGPFYCGAGWTLSQVAYQFASTPPHAATPVGTPVRLDLSQSPEAILGCRWPFGNLFSIQAEARLALNGAHTGTLAFGAHF